MKKPDSVPFSSNRRLSFNLGGGLQGLTKPPSHHHSTSTSSSTSPNNGAASPASSYAPAMSPPPHPATGAHQRTSSVTTPSHPAIRTQAGSSSQMTYDPSQAGRGLGDSRDGASREDSTGQGYFTNDRRASIPPISPAGIPSQQPTFLNTAQPQISSPYYPAGPMDIDSETHDSPAQQLKQQLRRISDPKVSPFRQSHSRSRSQTPRTSLNQVPRVRTPSLPDFTFKRERRPSTSQATTPSELAANGVAVREFPETPADNQDLIQKMIMDLRRASNAGSPPA